MTESYEGNGEYSYNDEESDFKRKKDRENSNGALMMKSEDNHDDDENDDSQVTLNEKANDYIRDCILERNRLEKDFPIAERLLNAEIESVQKTGRIPSRDAKYADIYREKPIRVAQKIRVPIREHPKFNFVGKLLGPKGNSLKRLQDDTQCKMTVLGRNSMRDRAKEEELRASMDPKYAHLNEDLHVEIATIASPAEAYARIAYAMAELRKYLTPDSNDEIRQEQLRELLENPPPELEGKLSQYKKGIPSSKLYSHSRQPSASSHSLAPIPSRSVIPQKQKVFSILEKARSVIDDSYRVSSRRPYDDHHHHHHHSYQEPSYDNYSYAHHSAPPSSSRIPYDTYEYDPQEYSRASDYYSQPSSYPVKSKLVKSPSSSSPRQSWKAPSSVPSYSPSSRRHDDHLAASSGTSSTSKHAYSSREARYKSAPYARTAK